MVQELKITQNLAKSIANCLYDPIVNAIREENERKEEVQEFASEPLAS